MYPRLIACLTAWVVLASCSPQAAATPIAPQVQATRPHPTSTPAPTDTSGPLDASPTEPSPGGMAGLQQEIDAITSTKEAVFGIGIYDFEDQATLFINRDKPFVMLSVVKFPQALAILDQVDQGILDYDTVVHFEKSDLQPNTYSPLRDETSADQVDISLTEALGYTISRSDNNVCDKLFKILGGTQAAEAYIHGLGLESITIATDYADMAENTIYANQSSPQAMLELLRMFYDGELLSPSSTELLWEKLVETSTGPDRIKGLLPEGTVVGHKTGTSGTDEAGVTAAFNDMGIVNLPDGGSFAIVIFIADSQEDSATNAATIAAIARAAYDYLNH